MVENNIFPKTSFIQCARRLRVIFDVSTENRKT